MQQMWCLLAAATSQGATATHYSPSVTTPLRKRGLITSVIRNGFHDRDRRVMVYVLTSKGVELCRSLKAEAANV
jgi:DNA-binding MarR family transcriptional regulator